MKRFFDKEVLAKIQSLESPVKIIDGFLSQQEVDELVNFELNAKERFANRDDARKTGLGKNGKLVNNPNDWDPKIKEIVLGKIEKEIGPFLVADDEYPPHFFRTYYPLSLHADTGRDPSSVIYKQILIPLEINPVNKAKTIIFNNAWYGPAATFKPKNSSRTQTQYTILDDDGQFVVIDNIKSFYDEIKDSLGKQIVKDNKKFTVTKEFLGKLVSLLSSKRYNLWTSEHITDETPFNKENYDEYLSHLPYDLLDGLKIERVFDWKPGSALIWNRTKLHSSNNYLKERIQSKMGLAVFTIKK